MSEMITYSFVMIVSVCLSSVSQIILKKSAINKHDSRISEYLNVAVIFAYILFFGCTLITMFALKVIPLSMAPILEATAYIFIPVLSFLFLKETMSRKQIMGMSFIIVGILIFGI